jgi:hypothetical protein
VIHLTDNDVARLVKAFEKMPKATRRQMVLAMKIATRDAATVARAKHNFISRSGALESSIQGGVVSEHPLVGEVRAGGARARHARFVHDGTGVYAGHEPWVIRPVNKKRLRWVGTNGRFVFAKSARHFGQRPDPFLANAVESTKQLRQMVFLSKIRQAEKEAGL